MSAPDLSVVLVHYQTPELVSEAVAALRADLDLSGTEAELILVDNGSEPGDREGFEALGLRLVETGGNVGYAAGLHRGVAVSSAPVLVLMNPDVLVAPGCLGALLAALGRGAAAAGPRFVWDRGGSLALPPAERRDRLAELRAARAHRGGAAARRARARWRAHAQRHWLAVEPVATPHLAGALLAVRRDAWERTGGFDEGYRLYFEETDWLHRLAAEGLESRLVPAARAVHLFDRSGAKNPRAEAWFEASRERFFRRRYGALFTRLALSIERRAAARRRKPGLADLPVDNLPGGGPPAIPLPAQRPLWIEVSPREQGFPAAAAHLGDAALGSWRLPQEVWEGLRPGPWWLRAVADDGRELAAWRAVKRD